MKLITWNVNGIRSIANKGFLEWLHSESPDFLCLQEVKAMPEVVPEALRAPINYKSHFFPAEKPGYSGVAFYYRHAPKLIKDGLGIPAFDKEGRVSTLFFDTFTLVNAYFPNSQRDHKRLPYKLDFCVAIQKYLDSLKKKGPVILCGDFNIAHNEIDLKNPKSNMNNAGFLPEERKWMDSFLSAGYKDIFRERCKDPGHYTWWSYRPGVREKNIGWRLDYHCTSPELVEHVKESKILCEVPGSDHCPVLLTLK